MADIKLHGEKIHTCGQLPFVGTKTPGFTLTGADLVDHTLLDYTGKRVVLNIFPSLDTSVCAMSVRAFNAMASKLDNTVVLCVSMDLPFAHKRFCVAEGLDNVITLSEMRDRAFGDSWGLRITDSPMKGLLARAVVVLDEMGMVLHTELVPEIAQEPDYNAVKVILR